MGNDIRDMIKNMSKGIGNKSLQGKNTRKKVLVESIFGEDVKEFLTEGNRNVSNVGRAYQKQKKFFVKTNSMGYFDKIGQVENILYIDQFGETTLPAKMLTHNGAKAKLEKSPDDVLQAEFDNFYASNDVKDKMPWKSYKREREDGSVEQMVEVPEYKGRGKTRELTGNSKYITKRTNIQLYLTNVAKNGNLIEGESKTSNYIKNPYNTEDEKWYRVTTSEKSLHLVDKLYGGVVVGKEVIDGEKVGEDKAFLAVSLSNISGFHIAHLDNAGYVSMDARPDILDAIKLSSLEGNENQSAFEFKLNLQPTTVAIKTDSGIVELGLTDGVFILEMTEAWAKGVNKRKKSLVSKTTTGAVPVKLNAEIDV